MNSYFCCGESIIASWCITVNLLAFAFAIMKQVNPHSSCNAFGFNLNNKKSWFNKINGDLNVLYHQNLFNQEFEKKTEISIWLSAMSNFSIQITIMIFPSLMIQSVIWLFAHPISNYWNLNKKIIDFDFYWSMSNQHCRLLSMLFKTFAIL